MFTIVGIGSFFSSFGSLEPPRYFWCVFVGVPLLLAVDMGISTFVFMGAVTRYMANEVAPVGTDVVNYMAEGTRGGRARHGRRGRQRLPCWLPGPPAPLS